MRKVFKIIKIITISGVIIVLIFVGFTLVYSALTHNAFRPKVRIYKKEKEFIKKIQDECNCMVRYEYDYNLINGLEHNSDKNKRFYIDLVSYNEYNNWCMKDTVFIKNKASEIINDFISLSKYSHLYENIIVIFIVYKDIGKDERLIQTICEKRIEYNIQKDTIKYITIN